MNDPLRSKLSVIVVAGLAFAAGLGVASGLDLPHQTRAAETEGWEKPDLQVGLPDSLAARVGSAAGSGFADVVERVSGAVVTIQVEKKASRGSMGPRLPSPFDRFFRPDRGDEQQPRPLVPASGSGFVISPEGYVVTNNHVVEGAENITVKLADRREIDDVKLVGRDPTTDVALLKIEADDLVAAPLGRSDSTRVGEWVLAIGSPGLGNQALQSTVTAGIVSAKGRSINILNRQLAQQGLPPSLAVEDFIQTDAVINPGNSGGPLVNVQGEVIGMNTAIMSETGFYQGYGFAVPIELVRSVVDDLTRYGEVRRPVLGVLVQGITPSDAKYYGLEEVGGAVIQRFSGEDSPARQAGLKSGDAIVAVDDERIGSVGELQRKIRSYEPGETVTVTVVHRGTKEREEFDVTLTTAESPGARGRRARAPAETENPLGIEVAALDQRTRQELEVPADVSGVVVMDASAASPLIREAGGLSKYTIVEDINGEAVESVEAYREIVSGLEPGSVVSLRLYEPEPGGEGNRRFVTVEIPAS